MESYNNESNPETLNNYLVHLKVVKQLAERTIQEYYFDIRLFLKYIHRNNIKSDAEIEDININDMSDEEIRNISVKDVYNFIFYVSYERRNNKYSRYRKLSAIRSFFKYLTKTEHITEVDPTRDIDMPAPKMSLPKFLSLDESMKLLQTLSNRDSLRDYCIITLFLNCGMRLSELISINVRDIDFSENRIRILGKGNKERMIYLNIACISALQAYIASRNENPKTVDEPALFISNQNRRISKRRVQQIVEKTIKDAETSIKKTNHNRIKLSVEMQIL
ncbi:MAG: tyrosine-type recombinase/integrase [Ruminococcus sp.]|nr:tyrosine-type recombinase/integrase [Ruminococcus sp.]